jgi:hypothetical protein
MTAVPPRVVRSRITVVQPSERWLTNHIVMWLSKGVAPLEFESGTSAIPRTTAKASATTNVVATPTTVRSTRGSACGTCAPVVNAGSVGVGGQGAVRRRRAR